MLVSFKFKASTGLEAFILNGYLLQKSPGHFTLTRLVEIALGVYRNTIVSFSNHTFSRTGIELTDLVVEQHYVNSVHKVDL
jgi:hypothetical protein